MPGLSPSTRPTRSVGVALCGKLGSIQLMGASVAKSRSLRPAGGWDISDPDAAHPQRRWRLVMVLRAVLGLLTVLGLVTPAPAQVVTLKLATIVGNDNPFT